MAFLAPLIPWIQIILSILVSVAILLQQNESTIGSAFGSSGSGVIHTKRGIEKILFRTTIILAILFVITAIWALVIQIV